MPVPVAAARAPAAPRTRHEASKGPKARILLLGDSLMATDLGLQLEAILRTPHTAVLRAARSATGMSRPDVLDWVSVARAEVTRFRPHLVIVLIGANDGQDLAVLSTGRRRRVRRIHWKTPAWARAYRERLDALLAALGALGPSAAPAPAGPLVLWMGLPPVRSRKLEAKLAVIRALQREAMRPLGHRGQYAGLLPFVRVLRDQAPRDRRGRIRRGWLRKRDGVHFSFGGAQRMARAILPLLLPWVARAQVEAALTAAGTGRSTRDGARVAPRPRPTRP